LLSSCVSSAISGPPCWSIVAARVAPPNSPSNAAGPTADLSSIAPVRVMFVTYLTVIVTGIVYFSVIGLTHH
jgi:hypothetical protein